MFDYSKLRGRIVERYGTLKNYARALDMNPGWLTQVLKYGTSLRSETILRMAGPLGVSDQIQLYFFSPAGSLLETEQNTEETTNE